MSGSQGSKKDDKRSAFRRMWGTPKEEKAVQMLAANGLLLAYYEERHGYGILHKVGKSSTTP